MSVVVLGATGRLGRHVLDALAGRSVEIRAAGRDLSKIVDRDVRPVRVDYADESSIRTALQGARRALLISSPDFGRRVDQHARVVAGAREAGLELLAYTSTPRAGTSTMTMAADHAATEALIRDSGVPFTMLRNAIYLDVLVEQTAGEALRDGAIVGASGPGRLSPASRGDLALAAAEVLTGEGHAGAVYELGADRSYTMAEVAAAIAAWSGRPIAYRDLPVDDFRAVLLERGLPPQVAEIFADTQRGMARDEFHVTSGDLARLIGRRPETFDEALAASGAPR
ncbi:NmrA family NAD(P)-binding protein [Catenuloplanes japonicus]|uniref:NmrA family NAD(P)-binding protein n=1 Tax=Catenuloplanes japonicus TaxID=33876 RepID=UPI000689B475|nr:NmrA family NAD(P)-binding protein [Catenuloplanes japonicus]